MYQVATVIGVILGFVGALALANMDPSYNWRVMLGLAALPALIILPVLIRLPQTARWLMMVGREQDARDSLAITDPAADQDEVIHQIQEAIDGKWPADEVAN